MQLRLLGPSTLRFVSSSFDETCGATEWVRTIADWADLLDHEPDHGAVV